MPFKFNPFTGNFDQTGSGGGGSSYIDGEVATYNDLPLDGTAALNSAWLVREASGTWLLGRKPAGIYIRTATAGVSRDADYTYAGILPDVFSDANFTLYDDGDSTKNAKFQLSAIATGTTRTISVPDANITLDDAGDSRTPSSHASSHASSGSDPLFDQDLNTTDAPTFSGLNLVSGDADGGLVVYEEGSGSVFDFTADGNGIFSVSGQNVIAFAPISFSGPSAATNAATTLTNLGGASDDHGHGNLTNDGKVGSTSGLPLVTTTAGAVTTLALGTANQVLRVNSGATGVEFADPSGGGGGVSAIGASAADILSVSGSDLVADDPNADRIVFWDDSASKLTHLEVGSGLSISGTTLTATGGGGSGGTKTYAVFTAEHNQPPSASFATLDTRNSIAVLDFSDTATESAVFVGVMPEAAVLASGLIVRLYWMGTATTGDVRWSVAFERGNTDLDADSFDTATASTATTNATSGIVTITSITCTNIDGITAGDLFRLRVQRLGADAADTMAGAKGCELVAVEVRSAA